MLVLVTSLCLTFSGADIEFDFLLTTSAYSEHLKDSYLRCATSPIVSLPVSTSLRIVNRCWSCSC